MEMFETVVIFQPNETIAKEEVKKFTNTLQGWNKTKKVKVEDLGIKTLAYEVKNNKQGYYAEFTYQCNPVRISELERLLRVNKNVIKFLTTDSEYLSEELEDYIPEEDENTPVDLLDIIYNLK